MPHRLEEAAYAAMRQTAGKPPAPAAPAVAASRDHTAPPVEDSSLTAAIVEWDDRRGYGFLRVGTTRVFLHRRDFAEWHKRPVVGDVIRFTMGVDARGRTCGKNAVHLNDGGRITAPAILLLLCLLVLPALALHQRSVDSGWAVAYALLMGGISYGCYARDKRQAKEQAWRVPESKLHLTELLGGWPGAFLAQRRLRHKVSKQGFQITFWLIVLTYQWVALDSLIHWKLSRAAWAYLRSLV